MFTKCLRFKIVEGWTYFCVPSKFPLPFNSCGATEGKAFQKYVTKGNLNLNLKYELEKDDVASIFFHVFLDSFKRYFFSQCITL